MKRLIVICTALLIALPVADAAAAKGGKGAKGAASHAKACKATTSAKAAKKPGKRKRSCAKSTPRPPAKGSSGDPATRRAEKRCRGEQERYGAAFRRAWGGRSASAAMARCVAELRQEEWDWLDEELEDEELDEGLEDEELDEGLEDEELDEEEWDELDEEELD